MESINTLLSFGIKSDSRVLVCMPHPDDEAVFISGLLQHLSSQNIPTQCLTFTAGENSTLRFGLKPNQDLATARKNELSKAYAILGITNFQILDFPDGGLDQIQPQIKQIIKKYLVEFSPTHLITLEPDGIYGHPDHIALSKSVTNSVTSTQTIIYATVSPRYIMPSARHMAKKSVINPIFPTHTLGLNPHQSWVKIKALLAHRSQFLHFPQVLFSLIHFLKNDMLTHEYYFIKKGKP
jgi:LmbE family N-acetylglucosaminyl deacetylase